MPPALLASLCPTPPGLGGTGSPLTPTLCPTACGTSTSSELLHPTPEGGKRGDIVPVAPQACPQLCRVLGEHWAD